MCWLMPTGLPPLVVFEVQLRQTHDHRLAVAQLELRLHAAADDLFRRDAVNRFSPRAHEFDTTARHDEVPEAVRAQIGEHFEHRLAGHLGEAFAGCRMLRVGDPVLHDLLELHRGHARVRGHHEFEDRVLATSGSGLQIALEQRSESFLVRPLRMLRREGFHAVQSEEELDRHRLLAPERAVVVEHGDAFGDGHEVRRAFLRHLLNKGDDGFLRRAIVP